MEEKKEKDMSDAVGDRIILWDKKKYEYIIEIKCSVAGYVLIIRFDNGKYIEENMDKLYFSVIEKYYETIKRTV